MNEITKERSKLSIWLQAARLFSITASATSVVIGTIFVYTYYKGPIHWSLVPIVFVCAVLFHIAANIVSDYYDWDKTVDRTDTYGSSGVLAAGLLKPKTLLTGGLLIYLFAFLFGMVLVFVVGLKILYLGLIGLAGGYFYTAKPFRFKYMALGDLMVFLFFGPLLVIGTFMSLTGTFDWNSVYVSIPVGMLVIAILHANNTRDMMFDTRAKIKTMALLLGLGGAKFEYFFLVIGAYLGIVLMIFTKVLSPWTLIVFLSLPPAIMNLKTMLTAQVDKPTNIAFLDVKTAQHHLLFGLLLTIGILLTKLI